MPAAQLFTVFPQPWVVLLMAIRLIPWIINSHRELRSFGVVTLFSAVLLPAVVPLGDGVVASRFGRHWLLARHRGRAALVSKHADPQSCRVAKQLAHAHGHRRLVWFGLVWFGFVLFGLDCSVGPCGVGGDGLLVLDGGACPGSPSGKDYPGEGTTLA